MTREDVRERLYGYRRAKRKLTRTLRELEELETLMTSASLDYSTIKVKSSPEPDKIANRIDKLSNLISKVSREREDAINEMVIVENLISHVKDEDVKNVLVHRYIKCMQWIDVAKGVNFSIPRAKQLEAKGISLIRSNIIHNYIQ